MLQGAPIKNTLPLSLGVSPYNWPLGVSSCRNDKLHGAAVFSRPGASWLIPGAFLGRSCPPGSRLQGVGLMLHPSRAVAVDDRRGIGGQVPSWGRSRPGRWSIHVTSTAPRWGRVHTHFFASLGGFPPISVCLSLYIFLYIYRAIRGTGCVWWCFSGGAGLCVCNGGPWLIPSRRPAVIIQGRKKRAPWYGFPLSLIMSRPWA